MNEWISVSEQFPENEQKVLILCVDGYIDIDIYEIGLKDNNLWSWTDKERVTHWMPLPNFPVSKPLKKIIK